MKAKTDKNIEQFVEKVIKSSSLETPSFDFTAKVMAQVSETSRASATMYQPLISTKVWGVLLLLGIGVILFSIFSEDSATLGWFDILDLGKIPNLFSGIKISNTAMYGLLMFALMLFIQIPILKHYFNKRFEI